MKNQYIQLVPVELSLAEQAVDYYKRNRAFLETFEPVRSEEFFTLEYQQTVLKKEMADYVLVKQNCNTSVQNFSGKLRIYSTVSLTMSL